MPEQISVNELMQIIGDKEVQLYLTQTRLNKALELIARLQAQIDEKKD